MKRVADVICPLCRFPVGPDGACTGCHEPFDPSDWVLPEVYGTVGLIAPKAETGRFELSSPPNPSSEPGSIQTPLPFDLDPSNDSICHIGGDGYNNIHIAGAAIPHQVTLHFNQRSKSWWAFDWGSGSDATVNGKRFRNCALKDDAILCIAGVKLHYRSNRIWEEVGSVEGVDLVVSELTDARMTQAKENHPSHPLLDHISFVIPDGEFVGVIGPSGCGKSTLIKALAGIDQPAEGRITFNGKSREEDSAGIRDCTAYLPQSVDATLHDDLTLEQEIESYSAIHLSTRDRAFEETLLRGLKLSREGFVGKLSGGERRRAAFLLALLRNPSVLLLDEPAAGLDRASETALMKDLRGMTDSDVRRTIVCATHELANIGLFDRVLVMADGCLVYNDSPNYDPPGDGAPGGRMLDELGIPGKDEERFEKLYDHLGHPSDHSMIKERIEKNRETMVSVPDATDLPKTDHSAGWFRSLSGYLGRFIRSFVAFVSHPVPSPVDESPAIKAAWIFRHVSKWAFNLPLTVFLWQPLVIGFCLCAALKSSYGEDDATVFFCAAIAAFWLGMSGSVRSLVSARPGRCLERLEGVSRTAYLSAVLSSSLARGLLQGIALTAFLYLFPFLDGRNGQWNVSAAIGMGGCLVAVEWMGGCIGLALSALAPTETFAVTMVPNLAVVALFFSEPLMGTDKANLFAKILPAHAAYRTMEALNDPICAYPSWILPTTTVAWLVVPLAIAFLAQTVHEKTWKG